MKHHIYLEYSKQSDVFTRLDLIKKHQFDGIFIKIDENDKNKQIVNYARTIGLDVEAMHLAVTNCNHLWIDDELGNDYVNGVIAGVEQASKLDIPIVVMHISSGNNPPAINPIALERVEKILSICEKNNVYLALENLRRLDYLDYIYGNINHPYLKFCFDSGHANAFTKNIESFDFAKYQDKLVCIHLSDNHGDYDEHLIPTHGNINWLNLIKKFKKIGFFGPLTLEAVTKENSFDEELYLQEAKKALLYLESLYQEG